MQTNRTLSQSEWNDFVASATNTSISFCFYSVLFVLVTTICVGKMAPSSTVYYILGCCKLGQHWKSSFWKRAAKTPFFVSVTLQIVVCYVLFRLFSTANEVIYYSIALSQNVKMYRWEDSIWASEIVGYYAFYLLFTLFVGTFLKSGLVWIHNAKLKTAIIVLAAILYVIMAILNLIFCVISVVLVAAAEIDLEVSFLSYGTAPVYTISTIILTLTTAIISISIIVVLIKSNHNKFKSISPQQKLEQKMIVLKFILASVLFLIANLLRLLGVVIYVLNYYSYGIIAIRTIPDVLIIGGISLVFWPFPIVPKCCFHTQKQPSKILLFIQQVVEPQDIINEFDEMSVSTTSSGESV